jgi:hypothetical protein
MAGDSLPRNPITGIACCVRASCDHTAATFTSPAIKSRRLIRLPSNIIAESLAQPTGHIKAKALKAAYRAESRKSGLAIPLAEWGG